MITNRQAVILVSGPYQDSITSLLGQHEALVQITSQDEIPNVWKHNKTPVVPFYRVPQICPNYIGGILMFTAPHLVPPFDQPTVTKSITEFCYKNSVDPGKFQVANALIPSTTEECKLCKIAQHPGVSTLEHNLTSDFVNMIIYETEDYAVIPGIGPLTPGFLMIISKEHHSSLHELVPGASAFEYYEIEEDINWILQKAYGETVAFYELATSPTKHMHVDCMLNADLSSYYRTKFCMRSSEHMAFIKNPRYFYYRWGNKPELGQPGIFWITDDPELYLPDQLHRQIWAEHLNLAPGQYDWRKAAFPDRTTTNVWQLYKFLSAASLPERIEKRTQAFVDAAAKRFEF